MGHDLHNVTFQLRQLCWVFDHRFNNCDYIIPITCVVDATSVANLCQAFTASTDCCRLWIILAIINAIDLEKFLKINSIYMDCLVYIILYFESNKDRGWLSNSDVASHTIIFADLCTFVVFTMYLQYWSLRQVLCSYYNTV